MVKPRVGISSCLLGEKVRYDGGHKRSTVLADILSRHLEWVPVCPEHEVGMGVPREPVQLVGEARAPRMVGADSGREWTEEMEAFCAARIRALSSQQIQGFVLKSRSPTCGLRVPLYNVEGGEVGEACGFFARELREKCPRLPLVEENELEDTEARERWMKKVYRLAGRSIPLLLVALSAAFWPQRGI